MDHCCFSCPFERKSLIWGGEAVSPLLKVFKTSLGKTWSNLVWPQSWPCFQQVRSDSSIAHFQPQRLSESVKNICPFLIRLLKPLAGTWPQIKDLQHITFIHCCFVSVCWQCDAVICFPVTSRQMFLSWLQQVLARKSKSETCRTCKNLVPW